jgi:phage terminase large subunit-like protein
MARASPALRRRLEIPKGATAKTIRYDATASFYTALSSDTGGAAKHGLNVHGVIIDELHVITDRELVTTLETGTGSRDQPLVAYITTAGIPGESPVWEDKRDQAVKVADGTVELEDFLTIIYAADPKVAIDGTWADPEVWADANPGLGISLRSDYIASKASEAAITPANLNAFLRLHLNVPSDALAGWLPLPTWDRSASIVDELDLHGARCFGGLDLASSLDLAALVLVFPDENDRIIDVVARFWTPEATLAKRAHRDRADYELWVREGWLTATPGETIDYDVIEADVGNLLAGLGSGCEAIDYDPWGSKQLRQHLEQAGAKIFELRQGFASISPPMKEAERLVVERNLRHGGNPVLRWMVANTVTVQDPAGNIKPDRKRSRSRIDGVVALIMAISAWQRSISRGRSVYDERGLEVVG